MGSGFGRLWPTLCRFRGIAEHQSASNVKLHIKHPRVQRTTWGAGKERGTKKNATYAVGVGVGPGGSEHEDWFFLETRFIGKDERKQSNTFGKLYLLGCVCVHVYVCTCVCVCVCLLSIFYLTFQEKCNKTEVEMNVGALQPRRFQNEKQKLHWQERSPKGGGGMQTYSLWIYISWLVVFCICLFVCLFVLAVIFCILSNSMASL